MPYRPIVVCWGRCLTLLILLSLSFVADGCEKPSLLAFGQLTEQRAMPDPLMLAGQHKMTSMADWLCRRQQLKTLFSYYEYGQYPHQPDRVWGEYHKNKQQLLVHITYHGHTVVLPVTLKLPKGDGPFPAFIEINRTAIGPLSLNRAGIAYLAFNPALVAVDQYGLDGNRINQGLIYDLYGKDIDTGVLMSWAWATHRIIDALQDVTQINSAKIAVNGFSRWGKAALIAGGYDQRIGLTVPCSAGLAAVESYRDAEQHKGAQTLEDVIQQAPQWFNHRFSQFAGHVNRLPVDANDMVALIAPRAIIATEGANDRTDDPVGVQDTLAQAQSVFTYLHVPDSLGLKFSAGAGHTITKGQQQAILTFARHFLLEQPVNTHIFEQPFAMTAMSSVTVSG